MEETDIYAFGYMREGKREREGGREGEEAHLLDHSYLFMVIHLPYLEGQGAVFPF